MTSVEQTLLEYWRWNLASKRTPVTGPIAPTTENMAQAVFDLAAFCRLRDLEILLEREQ